MTNEIIPVNEKHEDAPHNSSEFKGYSIEELRYQRALIALRKDFCKSKMIHNMDRIRKRGFFGRNGTTSRVAHVSGLASKIMSGLGYLDYVMIGMSIFGTGRKIFKFFRGKK